MDGVIREDTLGLDLIYVQGVTPRVILVDGRQLAEQMIDHDVGVTTIQNFEIKRVNLDYFAAEEGGSASS